MPIKRILFLLGLFSVAIFLSSCGGGNSRTTIVPEVGLTVATNTVEESSGNSIVLMATSEFVIDEDIVISLIFAGSATLNSDYTVADSIVITAGNTTASVTITIINDDEYEINETINITFGSVTNANISASQQPQTITITKNDLPEVGLTVATNTVEESSGNSIVLMATSEFVIDEDIVISLIFAGSATLNSDYTVADSIVITAGNTTASVTITIINDDEYEINETINITFGSVTNANISASQQPQTITITKNDLPEVGLTVATNTVEESSGNSIVLMATSEFVIDEDIVISLIFAGSATLNSDYTVADSIVITAGNTTASVTITIINDDEYEINETINITFGSVTNANISASQQPQTITITKNDLPEVGLTVATNTVEESSGNSIVLMATSEFVIDEDIVISLIFAGSATLNSDYTVADSIVITAGNTTASVTITIINDDEYEINETINITFGSVTNANISASQQPQTITITKNDLPEVGLTVATNTVEESSGNSIVLMATSEFVIDEDIVISLIFAGSATLNSDYTVADSIVITAGNTTASVTITIINDDEYEINETINITFGSVTNANISASQQPQTITITKNDLPEVGLTVATNTVEESSGNSIVLMATSEFVIDEDIVISLIFAGSATLNSDYTVADSIVITAGNTTASVTITIINDDEYEINETINITFGSVTNANISASQQPQTITITKNDLPEVGLTVATNTVEESSGNSIVLMATSEFVIDEDIVISLIFAGSATLNSDYTVADSIVITAGNTTASVTITIINDDEYEINETINITFGSVTNANISASQQLQTITITKNDLPEVGLTVATNTVEESSGNSIVLMATSEFVIDEDIVISLIFAGSATLNSDYTVADSIVITAGNTTASVTITIINDDEYEINETINITFGSVTNANISASQQPQTITITKNDLPEVGLIVATNTVEESSGNSIVLMATSEFVIDEDIVISLIFAGSATLNSDYTVADSIVITAGNTTASVTITIINDDEYEINETINITFGSVTNANISASQQPQTITITKNDLPEVGLTVATNTVEESSGNSIVLMATSEFVIDEDIVISLIFAGSATLNSDYTVADSIVITAGNTTASVTITIINDDEYEINETINITFGSVTNANISASQQLQTITITKNDLPEVGLTVATNTVEESSGNSIVLMATSEFVIDEDIVISLIFAGSATLNSDYTVADSIVITAGNTTASVTITIINDDEYEINETINITFGSVTNANISASQQLQTITITKNDLPEVGLTVATNTVEESSGNSIVLMATSEFVIDEDIVISLIFAGSATLNSDYTVADSIVITAGNTTASVTITIINDDEYEINETINITFGSVTNANISASQQLQTITITKNDLPEVGLTVATNTVEESSGNSIVLMATSEFVIDEDIVISLIFAGSATLNSDYTVADSIVITAGNTTASVTITIINDDEYEINETINITFGSVTNANISASQQLQTITITKNDLPEVGLTVATNTVEESSGNSIVLMATSEFVIDEDIVISLIFAGSATLNSDYTVADSIVITAGNTTASVTITIINDDEYEINETINITFGSVTNANISASQQLQTITITKNDLPEVGLTVATNTVEESSGNSIVLMATSEFVIDEDIVISLIFAGSATLNSDYTVADSIVITAGNTTASVTITIINDDEYEINETINITFGSVTNANISASQQPQTITITKNDLPEVGLTVATNTVEESSGNSIVLMATSEFVIDEDIVISLIFAGSATLNSDYTVADSIVITAGNTTASVTITIINDDEYEINETINITLASADNAFIGIENNVLIVINEYALNSGVQLTYDAMLANTILESTEFNNFNLFNTKQGLSHPNPLEMINAHKAYGYGLTGSGQTIAIMDISFFADHHAFESKTITIYGELTLVKTNGDLNHGLFVASVAAANIGDGFMNGVAPGADLHFADFFGTSSSGTDMYANHWANATDDASTAIVQNNSWGVNVSLDTVQNNINNNNLSEALAIANAWQTSISPTIDEASVNRYINALDNFQNHGVIVYAISNDKDMVNVDFQAALPEFFPQLKEAWIAAVNIDVTDATDTYNYERKSANCGSVASYCLGADGWQVAGAAHDATDSHTYLAGPSGTSFVAPQISGAVALLSEAFPNHTSEKLTNRLLASANNLFFSHDDSVMFGNGVQHGYNYEFGHGFMDIYAALQPITVSNYTRIFTNSLFDITNSYKLSSSKISIPRSFGNSVHRGLAGEIGYTYDDLNGGFGYDLAFHVEPVEDGAAIIELNKEFAGFLSNLNNSDTVFWKQVFNKVLAKKEYGAFNTALTVGDSSLPVQSFFDSNFDKTVDLTNYQTPYLKKNEGGIGVNAIYEADGYRLLVGATSPVKHNIDNPIGSKTTFVTSLEYGNSQANAITLMGGLIKNSGDLLGLIGSDAFSLADAKIKTKFGAFKLQTKLINNSSLTLMAIIANTDMTNTSASFIDSAENIRSSSFGVAVNKNELFGSDNIALFINQPNYVHDGYLAVRLADLADVDGVIDYRVKKISLKSSGRQLNYGLYYQKEITDDLGFAIKYIIADDLNNENREGLSYAGFVGVKFKNLKIGTTINSNKTTKKTDKEAKITYSFDF